MLKVFYYYYYLFYTKVLVQPEPHFVTVLALSASEGLLINAIIDFLAIKFYCTGAGKWTMLSVFTLLLVINFVIYGKNKVRDLIKEKPMFFGSKRLSLLVSLIFFLITSSWLFWGAVLGKYLLEQCR